MFDTIILLSGPAEHFALSQALLGHNLALKVIPIGSCADLDIMEPGLLRRARLIAFATAEIVPRACWRSRSVTARSTPHPGPAVSYPGWAPAHFALHNRATEFGATVRVMVEKVDAGPIIDVALFPIPAGISVLGLEGLAYAHLAQLFWRMAQSLATDAGALPTTSLQWGPKKYSRRAYRAICDIPLDIPKDELEHRIKVFGGNHFGMAPTIHLHGVEFRAVAPSGEQSAA